MNYFDFHAHPAFKGSLTDLPAEAIRHNAWNFFNSFRIFWGKLKVLPQLINSQANLSQLNHMQVIAVVPLLGLEKAFARNLFIYRFLASNLVTPLHRPLLRAVRKNRKTYFDMLCRDLNHLVAAGKIQQFHIVKRDGKLQTGLLNTILSVEGAHCFQSVKDSCGVDAVGQSILKNFQYAKDKSDYRLLYLTLAHLTRQPASVHCFGVQLKLLEANMLHDEDFQPNPREIGISDLGKNIIRLAYENTTSKRVFIDIKHMSYVARQQFYEMRETEKFGHIPLIASHIGVTGTSLATAKIKDIEKGSNKYHCDKITWYQREGLNGTYFNPWTINFFDEDIVKVIESYGLIGVSLDQRILGVGEIYEECMSQVEVDKLKLEESKNIPGNYRIPPGWTKGEKTLTNFLLDKEVLEILRYEERYEPDEFTTDGPPEKRLYGDLVLDLDESQTEEEEKFHEGRLSHFDHLANNILHIIKVAFKAGFDGVKKKPDVRDCICIGSDLDGLIHPINLPKTPGGGTIDKKTWARADRFDRVKQELILSIQNCLPGDSNLRSNIGDVDELVEKIMVENGKAFLAKNL